MKKQSLSFGKAAAYFLTKKKKEGDKYCFLHRIMLLLSCISLPGRVRMGLRLANSLANVHLVIKFAQCLADLLSSPGEYGSVLSQVSEKILKYYISVMSGSYI